VLTQPAVAITVGRGGRPTREEAKRRLKRVLEVAQHHFLASGYRETSLETVARDAGVAKKTLYHHFGDKAGLFASVLAALREAWIAEIQRVVLGSDEPRAVLEAVALHTLDVGTRPEMIALHRLLVAEAHRFPELVSGNYENGAPRGMEPLAAYLRKAVASGALSLDEPRLAAEQFNHLVLGGIRTRILLGVSRRPSQAERVKIARHAVQIFLAGCARRSQSPAEHEIPKLSATETRHAGNARRQRSAQADGARPGSDTETANTEIVLSSG
jgi:TetR/AcrR family transcriptional regulator, mexJK operon transcriptional repressor